MSRQSFVEEVIESRFKPKGSEEEEVSKVHRRTGKSIGELDEIELPTFGAWSWATNWKVVRSPGGDAEGWVVDSHDPSLHTRKWMRTRVTASSSSSSQATTSTGSSFDQSGKTSQLDGIKQRSKDLEIEEGIPRTPEMVQSKITRGLRVIQLDQQDLSRLERDLGTTVDSESHRTTIDEALVIIDKHLEIVDNLFAELASLEKHGLASGGTRSSAVLQATRNKLSKDFQREKRSTKELLQLIKRKAHVTRIPRVNVTKVESTNPDLSPGAYITREERNEEIASQMVLDTTLDVNKALIEEREEELKHINKELHQVKEMMTNVATMVETQGVNVKKIEGNAEASLASAEKGRDHIAKAEDLQKSNCVIS